MRIERTGGSPLPPELPHGRTPAMRRAVVCDRDELARSATVTILTEEGFDVVGQLADSRDLVELVTERRPDVVIAAIGDEHGRDLEALVDTCGQRIAPVVALAAESTPELVAAVRDAGALAFLTKPPTRADILPAVELSIARFTEITLLVAEVAAAKHRLEARKLIDRAKGLLMTHRRLSEPEALRWLQRTAMDRRKTALAIAAQVVAELGDHEQQRVAS
jgi:AmiR/NasT family two-component response regulator